MASVSEQNREQKNPLDPFNKSSIDHEGTTTLPLAIHTDGLVTGLLTN